MHKIGFHLQYNKIETEDGAEEKKMHLVSEYMLNLNIISTEGMWRGGRVLAWYTQSCVQSPDSYKPGTVVYTCNPSTPRGKGKRVRNPKAVVGYTETSRSV